MIAAGDALVGSAHAADGEVLLALPGGARGRALPSGELAGVLGRAGLLAGDREDRDGLLALPGSRGCRDRRGPGAPAGRAVARRGAARQLDRAVRLAGDRRAGDPGRAPALAEEVGSAADRGGIGRPIPRTCGPGPTAEGTARRVATRHVDRGLANHDRGGREDEPSAARIAGLLCASADLEGLPYALSPAPFGPGSGLEPSGDAGPASPFYGSTQLLAALARPPESEVPGIRLALRPDFDVTPEQAAGRPPDGSPGGPPGIELGEILDRNLRAAGPLVLPRDSLNRHVFVCGATGAGKSQTVRSLLEAASRAARPVARDRARQGRVPADGRAPPGHGGDQNQTGRARRDRGRAQPARARSRSHRRQVPTADARGPGPSAVRRVLQVREPFPQVLSAALGRVYEDSGWDLALGEPADGRHADAYPTLTALQRAAERVVSEIGYSQRVTDDVLGFIRVRLASLPGTARPAASSRAGTRSISARCLARNAVLEIEDVGDDADKAFLMGAVLIRLAEHLRLAQRTEAPPGVARPAST